MVKNYTLVRSEEANISDIIYRLEVIEYKEDGQVISFYCRVYKQVELKDNSSLKIWAEIDYFEPFGPFGRKQGIAQNNYKEPGPNYAGLPPADVAEKAWPIFKDRQSL